MCRYCIDSPQASTCFSLPNPFLAVSKGFSLISDYNSYLASGPLFLANIYVAIACCSQRQVKPLKRMQQSKPAPSMAESEVGAATGVSLGKGAWDCDRRAEIPPEREVRRLNLSLYVLRGLTGCLRELTGRRI